MAVGDVLFGVDLLGGAKSAGFAQILAEPADGFLAAAVLLEATCLIKNVVRVLGIDKKIRQDLNALGVVAGETGLPRRALLGFLLGDAGVAVPAARASGAASTIRITGVRMPSLLMDAIVLRRRILAKG